MIVSTVRDESPNLTPADPWPGRGAVATTPFRFRFVLGGLAPMTRLARIHAETTDSRARAPWGEMTATWPVEIEGLIETATATDLTENGNSNGNRPAIQMTGDPNACTRSTEGLHDTIAIQAGVSSIRDVLAIAVSNNTNGLDPARWRAERRRSRRRSRCCPLIRCFRENPRKPRHRCQPAPP